MRKWMVSKKVEQENTEESDIVPKKGGSAKKKEREPRERPARYWYLCTMSIRASHEHSSEGFLSLFSFLWTSCRVSAWFLRVQMRAQITLMREKAVRLKRELL